MKIYFNFNNYNDKLELLFEEIINYFKDDNNNLILIFDNIHSKEEYLFVKQIKDKIDNNIFNDEKRYIREFIEINESTLNILREFYEEKKRIEMIGNWKNKKLSNDLDIVVEFMNNKEKNYLSSYRKNIKQKISEIFKEYSFSKYLKIINLYYYLYNNKISQKEWTKIILSDELKDIVKFLYINISEGSLVQISFRNVIIEYYFNNFYIYYHNSLSFKENSKILNNELIESEKGFKFERQIIYSIIVGIFSLNYIRIKINRIYCVDKFKISNIENNNILFYQMNSNAPLYDFAILIKIKDNNYILKVYQVSIFKSKEDLEKLEKNKIIFDLRYFIEKVIRIFKIKIEFFSFGIIIPYQNYKNNLENTELISNFCIKNKYELLLYDLNNNKLYINESKKQNKIDLKSIKFFDEIGYAKFKFTNIFKNGYKIPKKLYIEKVKTSLPENFIKNKISSFSEDVELKLVGKFYSDISIFEQNDKYIFYYNLISKNSKISYIYYNYYLINQKIWKGDLNEKDYTKKEILAFRIKKKDNNKINLPKISFKMNKKDEELNIDYLIYDDNDDKLYNLEDEENEDIPEITFTKEQVDSIQCNTLKREIKFKNDFNEDQDLVSNESQQSKKYPYSHSSKNDENDNHSSYDNSSISEKIKNLNEKKSKDESICKIQLYSFKKDDYEALLKGDQNAYNLVKKKINKNPTSKAKNLLNKKRNNSFTSQNKPNFLFKKISFV